MNISMEDLIKRIGSISDDLISEKQFINPVFMENFHSRYVRAKNNAEDILNENRDLKIGIVGLVKAGKSSFLNALVFEGENVLPKAATPMTAALTRIHYSKASNAKVVFYNSVDWSMIERRDQQFKDEYKRLYQNWAKEQEEKRGYYAASQSMDRTHMGAIKISEREKRLLIEKIPLPYVACHELVQKAKDSGVLLSQLPQEPQEISVSSLKKDLQDYVGANGRFTPFVKYIEMGIDKPMLRGIEIIDTPGLGDPILSRSEKTKEFLMQCDIVFVLSASTQFMNKEDIALIMKTLPSESVNHAVLIGSKLDSVLLDDSSRKKDSIENVLERTVSKLNASARGNILAGIKMEQGRPGASILRNLQKSEIYYTSSLCYNAAKKIEKQRTLDEQETVILEQLENRFYGIKKTPEFLYDLAAVDYLKEKEFARIEKEKAKLLEEKGKEFARTQYIEFLKLLDDMIGEAEQNRSMLGSEDIYNLQLKLKQSKEAAASMRFKIRHAFEMCALEAKNYLTNMNGQIQNVVKDYEHLNVTADQRERTHTVHHGFWIFGHDEEVTRIEHYKFATVDDVLKNINGYINAVQRYVTETLKYAIDIHEMKIKIKDIVLAAFQETHTEFREEEIQGPVELVLSQLTVPPFEIVDKEKYHNLVLAKFSDGHVEGASIHNLAVEQTKVLTQISKDISKEVEKTAKEINRVLIEKSVTFTDDVNKEIQAKIEILLNNIANKEESIAAYDAFIEKLQAHKEKLKI